MNIIILCFLLVCVIYPFVVITIWNIAQWINAIIMQKRCIKYLGFAKRMMVSKEEVMTLINVECKLSDYRESKIDNIHNYFSYWKKL